MYKRRRNWTGLRSQHGGDQDSDDDSETEDRPSVHTGRGANHVAQECARLHHANGSASEWKYPAGASRSVVGEDKGVVDPAEEGEEPC